MAARRGGADTHALIVTSFSISSHPGTINADTDLCLKILWGASQSATHPSMMLVTVKIAMVMMEMMVTCDGEGGAVLLLLLLCLLLT